MAETVSSNGHKLGLFDIDGTLLSAGRVARQSILSALDQAFGWKSAPDHEDRGRYDFSGKTDPQIVRDLQVRFAKPEEWEVVDG